jgi:hypothetical protein
MVHEAKELHTCQKWNNIAETIFSVTGSRVSHISSSEFSVITKIIYMGLPKIQI